MSSKIAILGSHPATKMLAPFDDPDWAIYACSPHNWEDPDWHTHFGGKWVDENTWECQTPPKFPRGRLPRVDELFEVHTPVIDKTRSPEYLDYVREMTEKIPVWMQDRANHPKAQQYPKDELEKVFGPFLWTSSITYIMAKAIMVEPQPEAIGLWGVMQASKTEYFQQRPGLQTLIQRAWDRGIKVVCPKQSRLFEVAEFNW